MGGRPDGLDHEPRPVHPPTCKHNRHDHREKADPQKCSNHCGRAVEGENAIHRLVIVVGGGGGYRG